MFYLQPKPLVLILLPPHLWLAVVFCHLTIITNNFFLLICLFLLIFNCNTVTSNIGCSFLPPDNIRTKNQSKNWNGLFNCNNSYTRFSCKLLLPQQWKSSVKNIWKGRPFCDWGRFKDPRFKEKFGETWGWVRLGRVIPANQRHCSSISPRSFQYGMGPTSPSPPSPFPIHWDLHKYLDKFLIPKKKRSAESGNFPQLYLRTPKCVIRESFLGCFIFFSAKENPIKHLIGFLF